MKVSVITVTYNSAETLVTTIESVLHQTYPDIEYWIIDGHSRDNTIPIIQRYEDEFHGRLHWISEEDKGIYDAMNKGIQYSSGEVIGILNSDDFFTSDKVIEQMVREFTDDVDAVYGDVHFVKGNNLQHSVRYYSGRIFRPSLTRYGFIAPHPSFYIRKSIFMKYGIYNPSYSISADFELIARFCYLYHIRTKYIHLDFVTMRIGGASTRNLKARIEGARESIQACRNLGIKTNKYKICLKFAIKIIESLIIRK